MTSGLIGAAMLFAASTSASAQYESGFFSNWPGPRSDYYRERPVRRVTRPSYPKLAEAPKNDQKPQGQLFVLVSLDKQHLKIYDERGLFAESPISSGTKDHPTPMGIFSVVEKSKWHRSNLYSSAPMPFMQRITWSGVALHAGQLPGYPASHGCIRLPAQFASRLWNWSKLGARVIITPGEMSIADMSHRLLPARAPVLASEAPTERVRTADASGAMPNAVQVDAKPSPAADLVPSDVRGSIIDDVTDAKASDVAAPADPAAPEAPTPVAAAPVEPSQPVWMQMPKRSGQLAVFVSRKDSRLYVRQNFYPVFDVPITIKDDAPLGTHVFTARKGDGDSSFVWSATSLPSVTKTLVTRKPGRTPSGKLRMRDVYDTRFGSVPTPASVSEVLDRIDIPEDALQRIAYLLSPGSSIVVSDLSINVGGETGRGTEFIVPLR